ncbi:MAG: hypothetical protein O3C27_02955 [Actinomycetota bacterium]|nr:hypothetical protein [Actinomycetota bacterium]
MERARTFARKPDAEQWLARQIADISRGTWLDPAAGTITFGEWWVTYLSQSGNRLSTKTRDSGAADKWLLPYLRDVRLAAITPTMVRSLVDRMTEARLAPSTVRTFCGVLQGAMTAAVEANLIGRSPCRLKNLSSDRRKDPRFLSIDELSLLAEAIDPTTERW